MIIGMHIQVLESVGSTNNYAMTQIHDGKAVHGMVYQALEQTAGRGQRGKSWFSGRNDNMAFTAVLEPAGIPLSDAFLLNAAVALAVREWLETHVSGCLIKWPNDIFIHDKKLAGILVESLTRGSEWKFAIAGIGANINQPGFPPELPLAVSLKMLTGKSYTLEMLGKELCASLEKNWQLLLNRPETILPLYNDCLYCRNAPARFKIEENIFTAKVKQALPGGELLVETETGERLLTSGTQWVLAD